MTRWPMPVLALMAGAALACLAGCASTRPLVTAPCLKENQADLTIRWHTEDDSTGGIEGYELLSTGELRHFVRPLPDTTLVYRRVALVPHDTYCTTASQVQGTFLKVQALSVRGKRARVIDYVNAGRSVYLRAMWNPELQTFQSRDMRELYDDLMKLVPKKDTL